MADQGYPGDSNMVQCDVTGKWVPRDEAIDFQGRKVSAEGKAILLEKLRSGESLPGELEPPSVGRRFVCIFADNLMLVMFGLALVIPVTKLADPDNYWLMHSVAGIINASISIAYFTIMHGTRGQTIGKMLGKIKVVNADGTPIDMKTAFYRAMLYQGPSLIPPIVGVIIGGSGDIYRQIFQQTALQSYMQFIAVFYVIISIVLALSDKAEQKAIHDRVVKTRVIVVD